MRIRRENVRRKNEIFKAKKRAPYGERFFGGDFYGVCVFVPVFSVYRAGKRAFFKRILCGAHGAGGGDRNEGIFPRGGVRMRRRRGRKGKKGGVRTNPRGGKAQDSLPVCRYGGGDGNRFPVRNRI